LANCDGRMEWPERGVYFFMEPGENRAKTVEGLRIVRVGTHALDEDSSTKLWGRLYQHMGTAKTGGGYHRGSIFRLLVGTSLINKNRIKCLTWGEGSTAKNETTNKEQFLEIKVSKVIGDMPFLWLSIGDEPGPNSLRGYIEKNSIALLSNYNKVPLDSPSKNWLGHECNREKVRESGLWNQDHVDYEYDPAFLDELDRII